MLLLPATVTAREATDALRLLLQALKREAADATVVIDASNLTQFDSSALALLLECQRTADAWGKRFELRAAPAKLRSLARLYGIDALLMPESAGARTPR
jgi:phospholipid transport system transporter-binding protein